MKQRTALIALCLAAAACGPTSARQDGGGGGGADASGGGDGGGGNPTDARNGDGCSDAARLIYVIDKNLTLSKFDPATKAFTDVGALACPAEAGSKPLSMAVDRTATAYVLYNSGELFKVDTMTLACTATGWAQDFHLYSFGMGFSTDQAGGTTDTLYIAGADLLNGPPTILARLDTTSFKATQLGTFSGQPELTGTGNAELWGYFPSASPPTLKQLDKTTGATLKSYTITNPSGSPMSFAFAFWGGDFWVFLYRTTDTATTVYQLDGMTGALKGSTPTTGRRIVGAGVSTCAPTVIF